MKIFKVNGLRVSKAIQRIVRDFKRVTPRPPLSFKILGVKCIPEQEVAGKGFTLENKINVSNKCSNCPKSRFRFDTLHSSH